MKWLLEAGMPPADIEGEQTGDNWANPGRF